MKLYFFNPGSIRQISGGYLYNKHLLEGVREMGVEVCLVEEKEFPTPSQLTSIGQDDLLLIDSLFLFKNPSLVLDWMRICPVIGLVHLAPSFLPDHFAPSVLLLKIAEENELFKNIPTIVTSHFVKEKIIERVADAKVFVIPPAYHAHCVKTEFCKVPRKLLSMSNFVTGKGHPMLLEILGEFMDYDWVLDLYGNPTFDEAYVNEVVGLIKSLGMEDRVGLHPTIDQKDAFLLMSKSDLLIHNSGFETFGMLIHESASMGLPFLATRVGAWKTLANYRNGVFVTPDKWAALYDAIKLIFDSEGRFEQLSAAELGGYQRSWGEVIVDFMVVLSKWRNP